MHSSGYQDHRGRDAEISYNVLFLIYIIWLEERNLNVLQNVIWALRVNALKATIY